MTTQLEEVIVQAHLRQLEHIGPDRRHRLLQRGTRWLVILSGLTGLRLGQRLAVKLAVGGQRHAGKRQDMRRNHSPAARRAGSP